MIKSLKIILLKSTAIINNSLNNKNWNMITLGKFLVLPISLTL
ncbi:hypothetical protein H1P_180017 [Hyella patelloides LEGE 07179]|uniref:Uncharacterized protein n=1 Tax=Hyella patelloides LEGE 07179 TaxID=945734 RepID=A0A563VP30_9CYAN|nr:hypothetical protein H1P_180017 [Hyella patelloides LEGE 07179]